MGPSYHGIHFARVQTPLSVLSTTNQPSHGATRTLNDTSTITRHYTYSERLISQHTALQDMTLHYLTRHFLSRIKLQLYSILTTHSPPSFESLHSTISTMATLVFTYLYNAETMTVNTTFIFHSHQRLSPATTDCLTAQSHLCLH